MHFYIILGSIQKELLIDYLYDGIVWLEDSIDNRAIAELVWKNIVSAKLTLFQKKQTESHSLLLHRLLENLETHYDQLFYQVQTKLFLIGLDVFDKKVTEVLHDFQFQNKSNCDSALVQFQKIGFV